jgi:hypothetical protein
MRDSWGTAYTNNDRAKGTKYMPTKINNLEYDAPLEVRYWRHPAELATFREVENGSTYTTEVCIQTVVKLETTLEQQELYL